ncbi:MAG: transporter substrate-binding domain-containing protein, partial [Bdellovibrio sp.]
RDNFLGSAALKKNAVVVASGGKNILRVKIGVAPLCPYLCENGPGAWTGYIYDILKTAAREKGFLLEIENIPNTRLLDALKSHRVNYIIVPASVVRFESDIRVVGPKLGVSYTGAILGAKNEDNLIDDEYIKNKRVIFADWGGEPRSYFEYEEMTAKAIRLTGSDVSERMIKMIGEGRGDLALGDYNVLRYSLTTKELSSLRLLATSLTGFNSLVLVSHPKEPEFGAVPLILQEWFARNRKNGKLKAILDRYNVPDWALFLRPEQ